ncbi:MAG: 4Fe-4S dicluster domain-containing protein [Endomicrobia bacterium]|nr:4Fe-4S dicluster domain-containing protein [Endomicrobiia bacterium]
MKKFVTYSDLVGIIKNIIGYEIIFPTTSRHFKVLKTVEDLNLLNLNVIRPIEPIKQFFFPAKESLMYEKKDLKQIILGVKSCDIQAIKVLDKIFLSAPADNLYQNYRNNTILISCDCILPEETCFCSIVGGKPYVEQDDGVSDLNISFIDENNLILESFTDKGEEFLKHYFSDFDLPKNSDELKRNSNRIVSSKKVIEYNAEFIKEDKKGKYYKTVKYTYELDEIWRRESNKCVQCGGCNFICPSCYCFLIREASISSENQYRDKVWDVCHFTGYARVAGGANPRKYKYQRFRNRYQCKFVYRYENFDFYACTGCGRCIEVCPARIDIRKVVRSLVLAKGEQVLV